jgi:hemolysin activation/secretion protein
MRLMGAKLSLPLVACLGCFGAPVAFAQPAVPSPAGLPNVPQVSPLQHILPPKAPPLGGAIPSLQPLGTEGPVPNVNIPVRSATVIGASVFPASMLDAYTNGLSGNLVPLAKIEASRRALVTLYRDHGFILTTVTLDINSTGDVRFIVTEGRIVTVKLSQDIGPAGTMILTFLNHLTEGGPVTEAALERWLLLAQQVPGVSVHAVLQADPGDPGALTLIAEVSKQDVSALVTADNRGFVDTGPAEGLAVVDLNSVTQFGDQTEVSLYHTSGNTDNFGQISTSAFIGADGLRIRLYGGAGRSNPSGPLREIGYQSSLSVFGAQLAYPLILRRNQALTLTLHFDAIENYITALGTSATSDNLRIARFATQYAWQDLWAGDTRDALNIANAQFSQGIPAFGASPDGRSAPPAGRAGEKIDFWKLNGSLSRTQTLFSPLPATTLALLLQAGGQYTSDVLPSEEEFYLGGSRFTRGYYSGEVEGDSGAYATSELQLNTGDNVTAFNHEFDVGAQFYMFYDWGETWSNTKADPNERLASFGGGVRLALTRSIEVDGEAVRRLVTQLAPPSTGVRPLSDTILYWGVTVNY